MGKDFLDIYSVSHMIGGMILQRMGLSVVVANIFHVFFEFFENFIYVPYFGGRCIKLPPILPIEDCKTYDLYSTEVTEGMNFLLKAIR